MMACLEHHDFLWCEEFWEIKTKIFPMCTNCFFLPKIFLTVNKNWKYMLQQYNEILDSPAIFEHIFFYERLYDPENGAIKKVDKFPLVYSNLFINSTS